jgi:hypothetical protein
MAARSFLTPPYKLVSIVIEDVAQQDDDEERECDVQKLLDGEGGVANLVVDLVHHHGEYL